MTVPGRSRSIETKMLRILVVDHDVTVRDWLCELLTNEGYDALASESGAAAFGLAREQVFQLCICALRMPDIGGLELLQRLKQVSPETLFVLTAENADTESAIAALRGGAKDFLLKPLAADDILERLKVWVAESSPASAWQQRLSQQMSFEFRLQGQSALIRDVRQRLLQAAAKPDHLLLVGEAGSGRKQAARAVHSVGASRFVALDCRALAITPTGPPPPPGESPEVAVFEESLRRARGGTCYLANIDALGPAHQSEFYNTLRTQVAADTRVIATVGPDVDVMVVDGRLRADLYKLLSIQRIRIPPLRERREDILVLLEWLIDRVGFKNVVFGVSRAALEHLLGYDWPGNVAELATTLESSLAAAEGFEIAVQELPEKILMSPPLAPEDLRPKQIGSYRIEARLGVGGMGQVYRGYDEQLQRNVAIKQVADTDDPAQRERLRREARTAAQLKHPAIVQIYHLLEEDGHDYIVMEHLEGRTLAQYLEIEPLSLEVALALACDMASGLAAAHEIGVVHRDLKAANIILPPEGPSAPGEAVQLRAKILDFGLATPYTGSGAADLVNHGEVAGTYYAVSPEQIFSGQVDSRSDLFSFGSLLYEMVTGQRPFTGKTPTQVMTAVCYDPHIQALDVKPELPADLSDLIDRLLEKDPDDRPGSATEVRMELEEIRLSWLVSAVPDPANEPSFLKEEAVDVPEKAEEKKATSPHQKLLKSLRHYLRS